MHKIQNYENVNRFSQLLNFEISSSILFLLSFMYGIFLTLSAIVAIAFTPYLLYVLFREKRFGWITVFILFVLSPIILSFTLSINEEYFSIIQMVTLALFYFYCFVLRISVSDWIKEYNWSLQLKEQKREKLDRQKNFNITEIMK